MKHRLEPHADWIDTRAIVPSLALLAITGLTGCSSDAGEPEANSLTQALTGSVLYVAGSTSLNAADSALRSRLQGLGLTVQVKSASSSAAADATGKALVVISSTVSPSSVGNKFKHVTVPVLTWESGIYDDMGMTPTSSSNFGTQSSQRKGSVVTPSSPLAAGLSGTVTLASQNSTFSWGKPNAAAKVVTLSSDASKSLVFAYAAGQDMPGLTAPARRVGLFLGDTTATVLTQSGWALVDAAVNWAVGATTAVGPLAWPIDCVPGSSCAGLGYPDANGDGQAFDCSSPGYAGHEGTDIGISSAQMTAGINVRAAADGVVWFVSDGKYDGCPSTHADCQAPTGSIPPGGSSGTTVCTELGPYCQSGGGDCYWCFAGGNVVVIRHDGMPGVFATRYDHFKKNSIVVAPGDHVTRGQFIGKVGSAGASTGPHLHFEVWGSTYYDVVEPWAGACGPNFGPSLWASNPPWQ